jgi:hypothetical protein
MPTRVGPTCRRRWGGWGAGLCLAVGAGAIGGCGDQDFALVTRLRQEPVVQGAVDLAQPVVQGAGEVVRPVFRVAAGLASGVVNLVFLDSGVSAGERDYAQLSDEARAGGSFLAFPVAIVYVFCRH